MGLPRRRYGINSVNVRCACPAKEDHRCTVPHPHSKGLHVCTCGQVWNHRGWTYQDYRINRGIREWTIHSATVVKHYLRTRRVSSPP